MERLSSKYVEVCIEKKSKEKDVSLVLAMFCLDIKFIGDGTDLDDGWIKPPIRG